VVFHFSRQKTNTCQPTIDPYYSRPRDTHLPSRSPTPSLHPFNRSLYFLQLRPGLFVQQCEARFNTRCVNISLWKLCGEQISTGHVHAGNVSRWLSHYSWPTICPVSMSGTEWWLVSCVDAPVQSVTPSANQLISLSRVCACVAGPYCVTRYAPISIPSAVPARARSGHSSKPAPNARAAAMHR
jgi:hypothetical protein